MAKIRINNYLIIIFLIQISKMIYLIKKNNKMYKIKYIEIKEHFVYKIKILVIKKISLLNNNI